MIKKYNKFLAIIVAVLLWLTSFMPVFAAPGDVSSISSKNVLVIGDYAFDLKDPSYTFNNFLSAARTVYSSGTSNQMYYNAGSAWYDLVANSKNGLVKPFTGIFNGDGKYKYYNMKVADFKSTVITATTITFTWTSIPNATGIKLQQSPSGAGSWTNSYTDVNLLASATACTVLGLTAKTAYDFRLVVTGGEHAGISDSVTVTPTAPVGNAVEVISMATYNAQSGNLVLTGRNFNTAAAINVTKLTIIGQGGVTGQVTLTSNTSNPIPVSSTSATVVISEADKTAVNLILIYNC